MRHYQGCTKPAHTQDAAVLGKHPQEVQCTVSDESFLKGFLGQHARWKCFAERKDISLFVHQSKHCAATDPTNDGEMGS